MKEKNNQKKLKTSIGSKPLKTISFFSAINEKAKKSMENIKILDDWRGTAQLICTKTDRKTKYEIIILRCKKQEMINKSQK